MMPYDPSNRDLYPTMGYQDGGAAPPLFGGLQFVYVQDPMTELVNCPSILIRQEPEFFEALTGCETPNVYHVFGQSPYGYKYLFKCLEQSECCERYFCPSDKREFNMDIIHCSSLAQLGMDYNTPFANMHKPFMCAMGCCCRPEVTITLSNKKTIVGKAIHIYTCCDPTFEVYDATGKLKYIVSADCCQCVLLCPGTLAKTYEGQFDIYDAVSNQNVGRIFKEPATYSEMVTDADSFTVNFPITANSYDKLLLMGLTIMIDYQFFETNANDERNKRRGRHGYGGGGFGGLLGLAMFSGGGGVHPNEPRIRLGGGGSKNKKRRKHK